MMKESTDEINSRVRKKDRNVKFLFIQSFGRNQLEKKTWINYRNKDGEYMRSNQIDLILMPLLTSETMYLASQVCVCVCVCVRVDVG